MIEWNKVRTYVVPENLKDFKVSRQLHDEMGFEAGIGGSEFGVWRVCANERIAFAVCEQTSTG